MRSKIILSALCFTFLQACTGDAGKDISPEKNASPKTISEYSKQHEEMKCYKPGMSLENPVEYTEERGTKIKPHLEQALPLWKSYSKTKYVGFDYDKTQPVLRFKPNSYKITDQEGVMLIGCTDYKGSDETNMKVSLLRAQSLANGFTNTLGADRVCVVPLGEYCDELGLDSGLKTYEASEDPTDYEKRYSQRFVAIKTYPLKGDSEYSDAPAIATQP